MSVGSRELAPNVSEDSQPLDPFAGVIGMFTKSTTNADKFLKPPLNMVELPSGSERAEQLPPDPPYRPYPKQVPVPGELPYEPYSREPNERDEPPYEPYKGI